MGGKSVLLRRVSVRMDYGSIGGDWPEEGVKSSLVLESCSGCSILQNKFYHVNFQHKLHYLLLSMITDRDWA